MTQQSKAEDYDFQGVLISSSVSSNLVSSSSSSSSSKKVLMITFHYSQSESKSQIQKEATESTKKRKREAGEASQSFCEICMEWKPAGEMFSNRKICRHSSCRDCIGKHVASKIKENVNLVKCPDLNCKAVLEPYHCRSIVPDEVLDRWSTSICETLILSSSRLYCPFKDCSGVMLVDDDGEGRAAIVRESECPYCRRLFCAQYKVPWHSEIGCEEFQRLDKNDTRREDLVPEIVLYKDFRWTFFGCNVASLNS